MIRARATGRVGEQDDGDGVAAGSDEGEKSNGESKRGRNNRKRKPAGDLMEDVVAFILASEGADKQRMEIEEKKLDLEWRHFEENCENSCARVSTETKKDKPLWSLNLERCS